MQNAATERVDDVRQFLNEVAQFARRRNDRVALLVQLFQLRVEMSVRGSDQRLRLAEQAGERAVNRVRGAISIGMGREAGVRSLRPELPSPFVPRLGPGF